MTDVVYRIQEDIFLGIDVADQTVSITQDDAMTEPQTVVFDTDEIFVLLTVLRDHINDDGVITLGNLKGTHVQ